MKAYNEYMDNISVSDTLHRRFVSCVANVSSSHRPMIVRRYATAFACLVVILLGVLTVPRLLPENTMPITDSSQQPKTTGPVVTKPDATSKPDATGQSLAIYHDIDISQIIRQPYEAKVPFGFFFDQWLMMMKQDKDLSIGLHPHSFGSHWDDRRFTKEDIASSLDISVIDPVLPNGDYTTKQYVLVDDEADETIAYRTDYYYFNKDTMDFQSRFSIFYFEEDHFSEKIEEMQNVTEVNGEIHIDDFSPSTNAYAKVPHVRKLVYLKNGVGIAVEAEANAVITGGKVEQGKSLELYELTDKQLIALVDTFVFKSPGKNLDLTAAYADLDFGAYLPQDLPAGFAFDIAYRTASQESNSLFASWHKGLGYIEWWVSPFEEDDKSRLTTVADTKNYDLSLYPIPRADSVPRELRIIVNNPIFRVEDLTLEVVQARAYEVSDAGDISGHRMRFSVLYGDTLVEINIKGATPEAVFEILQQIKK